MNYGVSLMSILKKNDCYHRISLYHRMFFHRASLADIIYLGMERVGYMLSETNVTKYSKAILYCKLFIHVLKRSEEEYIWIFLSFVHIEIVQDVETLEP